MNIPDFKKDIKQHLSQSVFHCDRSVHLKNLVKLYKSAANIFTQHAPLETKTVTLQSVNGEKQDLKKTGMILKKSVLLSMIT